MKKNRILMLPVDASRALPWIMVWLLGTGFLNAQTNLNEFVSPVRLPGGRSAALGEAIISDIYDSESMYLNPAALPKLRRVSIFADLTNDWESHVHTLALGARVFSTGVHAIALGGEYVAAREIDSKAHLRFTELRLDLAYGVEFVEDMTLGILLGGQRGTADGVSRNTFRTSIGYIYSPTPGTSYGVVYHGFGRRIRYSYDELSDLTSSSLEPSPTSILEVGSTIRFPTGVRAPVVTLSLAAEKNYSPRSLLTFRGGLEVQAFSFLCLRAGAVSANNLRAEFRYSAALTIANVEASYTIVPRQNEDASNDQSLRFDRFSIKVYP